MTRIIFAVLLFTFCSGLSAQNLDFERTGFEIKAMAMQKEKSTLSYHVSQNEIPSRFTLRNVLADNGLVFSPFIEEKNTTFRRPVQSKDPVIVIAPLKSSEVFAFGQNGSAKAVKNIAYKPASGGNIADAYCRALYASRNGN